MFVTITETEMRRVLDGGTRKPTYSGGEVTELVATWIVYDANKQPTNLRVNVYTSVVGGVSRAKGEDALRVALVDLETEKGVARATITQRTSGWETRLKQKIRECFMVAREVLAQRGAVCSCGGALALRTAKKGKYAGQRFWGCSNYPSCTNTYPYTEHGAK